ncbi:MULTISPECIES: serine/threonine-protein kinase [Nocardiopsidaceae]|uniref:Serine/threonine-protein kinase n=1 Tax=Streptomonospora nanhaiensis TaxID=1323731 RepID=A0ABY6YT18_9ACTN|nr:serine/threonine-protein kinase [Streptomonospora nanhaiensis]WAE75385.1 serine/threonine-protein kinase [Streptomonospora nanhaiensis]
MDDLQNQAGGAGAGRSSGRTVGHYRLVRSLGRGGFGEVFLGEAPDGSRAAVKVLHATWAGDPEMRRRFTTEVEQARRVSGFCIAAILDADPEAAEPWIATEFIDGPTLQAAVAHDGPRTGVELHRLAISTATALAAIHAAGVVHRDLKPDNIMLAADGPRVIDFGIARAVETTSVTASGVVGTIGYMAPEQLEGARLTSAVDIFSWGSVMVYAATGKEAFHGPTQASRIARILGGEPDLGPLGEPLAGIVRSCLDKDPDRRPDAATLLNRLISAPANGGPAPGTGAHGAFPATGRPEAAPDGGTRVGVERTRIAGDAPPQVDPTRVAPQAPVDPTRAYTRSAPDAARAHAAGHAPPAPGHASGVRGGPPPYTAPGTPTPPPYPPPFHPGPRTGAPGLPAPSTYREGGVPPYHFHGVRFTDPRDLAEAMQQNWGSAVQVFQDPAQRAALGAWLVDDLGDTVLDRSLFRGHVNNDANLALASFIAQLRPDLPPVFRGRGATVAELGELFTDPRPLLTGAPLANEMVLLARPGVLRILGAHHGDDSGELTRLADRLDEAERAGNAFHDQLTSELEGWRTARVSVSAALILAFLLHPERLVPPGDGGDRGVGEWIDILWGRVRNAPAPADAGCAAVVYGALPTLRALAEQRRHWEDRHGTVGARHEALRRKVDLQEKLVLALRVCRFAVLGLPAGIVMGLASADGTLTGLLVVVGVMGVAGVVGAGTAVRVVSGGPARRHQRYQELNGVAAQLPQLTTGVTRINGDLRKARAICGV